MSFFDRFKKDKNKSALPKDIEQIFQKLHGIEKVKQIVDKAISYRNLGHYDKAIDILKKVIKNHPTYHPAETILGITLLQKGDIVEAENYFKRLLSLHSEDNEYNRFENYANLGLIRWKQHNDIKGALEYYDLALKEPNIGPVYDPAFGLYHKIDEKTYEKIKSNVYRDLCSLYFSIQKIDMAKKYAIKRLKIVNNCPIASRVFGTYLLSEYIDQNQIIQYIIDDIEPKDLKVTAKCFQHCFEENPKDYYALFGICISLTCYGLWASTNNHEVDEVSEKNKYYTEKLGALAKTSETGNNMYEQYIETITNISKLMILQMSS